jgi:hypothetical protein
MFVSGGIRSSTEFKGTKFVFKSSVIGNVPLGTLYQCQCRLFTVNSAVTHCYSLVMEVEIVSKMLESQFVLV